MEFKPLTTPKVSFGRQPFVIVDTITQNVSELNIKGKVIFEGCFRQDLHNNPTHRQELVQNIAITNQHSDVDDQKWNECFLQSSKPCWNNYSDSDNDNDDDHDDDDDECVDDNDNDDRRSSIWQCQSFNEMKQTVGEMELDEFVDILNESNQTPSLQCTSLKQFADHCTRMEMAVFVIIVETLRCDTHLYDLAQVFPGIDANSQIRFIESWIKEKFVSHYIHAPVATFWSVIDGQDRVRPLMIFLANACLINFYEVIVLFVCFYRSSIDRLLLVVYDCLCHLILLIEFCFFYNTL